MSKFLHDKLIYCPKYDANTQRYLSSNLDGTVVHMWHDEQSGRQRWNIDETSTAGLYTIRVKTLEERSNRTYLSSNDDGTRIDLWHEQDGSGRQLWYLRGVSGNGGPYLIQCAYSKPPVYRRYLSCRDEDIGVDLWTHDDGSSRQRWILWT
jgi:hypothetical protein